ncbi:type II secretion system protein E [Aliidongia dinghuensis]|uniref:Type II secretion system protein E n=1 Tax=Aliidongia dinghuensis TaxID=1867774 RepID=A0A8J2Z2D0_9PROT|nr:ATPase, T2SS/T4P/T4SS family [Aliidongia dinghuensis]GGF51464.1 type II secretion system protein E [Aliidongia dinghuensis]
MAASLEQYLIATGRVPSAALDRAKRLADEHGDRLPTVLTSLGLISERELAQCFAAALGVFVITSAEFPEAALIADRLNPKFLKLIRALPVEDRPDRLVLAMADPSDDDAADAIAFAVDRPVERRAAGAGDLELAWERLYGGRIAADALAAAADAGDGSGDDADRLKDLASEAPVIRLVDQIVAQAISLRASDIHIEPLPDLLRVRFRVDGVLREVEGPPARLAMAVISRIKVLAKLNIAERRLAQDGRIRLAVRGQEIDLRVSTTPTIHGESVVLRILDQGAMVLDFAALGFEPALVERWQQALARPHGIVLVTGPTGSGKTTTLYASLAVLNTLDRKILTIEDPVEYQLKGINQVQVKPQIGLTFASALRSFLRQDPDIMLIGEIRDLETAQTAVQASLTGHLILASLHTNDAASAITRLLDMGVEDYLLTSTLSAIAGQRLVRTLCPECKEAYPAEPELVERLGLEVAREPVTLWRPVGCPACDGAGFRGRTTIFELLIVTDAIRHLIIERAEARKILETAIGEGMVTMYQDGLRKALAGLTTVEEVLRATRET